MFDRIFDLGTRAAVISFLEWQRSCLVNQVRELNQRISDINHAIEWTRLGGDYGAEEKGSGRLSDEGKKAD